MSKKVFLSAAVLVLTILLGSVCVRATQLSIYDVQYTTDTGGNSLQNGNTIDCAGGVVINIFYGSNTKLTLWDGTSTTGWGGITSKDFSGADAFADINVGDKVSFTAVLVEEYRGNTQLDFQSTSSLSVISTGNALPAPTIITDAAFSEPYEAMLVQVDDVTITEKDLGAKGDIYNLQNSYGDYWASDYMNTDAGGPYHPYVVLDKYFDSISGILEQYQKNDWNYYQMLTLDTSSFTVPEPASLLLLFSGAGLALGRRKRLQNR